MRKRIWESKAKRLAHREYSVEVLVDGGHVLIDGAKLSKGDVKHGVPEWEVLKRGLLDQPAMYKVSLDGEELEQPAPEPVPEPESVPEPEEEVEPDPAPESEEEPEEEGEPEQEEELEEEDAED